MGGESGSYMFTTSDYLKSQGDTNVPNALRITISLASHGMVPPVLDLTKLEHPPKR